MWTIVEYYGVEVGHVAAFELPFLLRSCCFARGGVQRVCMWVRYWVACWLGDANCRTLLKL